jgi:hypothetical protein
LSNLLFNKYKIIILFYKFNISVKRKLKKLKAKLKKSNRNNLFFIPFLANFDNGDNRIMTKPLILVIKNLGYLMIFSKNKFIFYRV